MSTSNVAAVDTGHTEMIHDAQVDYYGKRLATASSDRTVKVFQVDGTNQQLIAELKGHDGPVWQVSWSHPQFGNLLASASFDRRVFIWKEQSPGNWIRVFEDNKSEASVNTVSFAPHVLGLSLAAGSADGYISIFTYNEQSKSWSSTRFLAHAGGVNSISWAPVAEKGSLLSNPSQPSSPVSRFVSGGCDNSIKIWKFNSESNSWESEEGKAFEKEDNQHKDWVRGVAWAPSVGLPSSTIASCSEDKTVVIWEERERDGVWKKSDVIQFEHRVWSVSWSLMGNILAVSQGDNNVSLYKESLDGQWQNISQMSDPDAQQ